MDPKGKKGMKKKMKIKMPVNENAGP